jgi:hypothetical protein
MSRECGVGSEELRIVASCELRVSSFPSPKPLPGLKRRLCPTCTEEQELEKIPLSRPAIGGVNVNILHGPPAGDHLPGRKLLPR